jgi:lysozyme
MAVPNFAKVLAGVKTDEEYHKKVKEVTRKHYESMPIFIPKLFDLKEQNMLTQDNVKDMIKVHEGYREAIYEDSVGVLTVGWGHALHEGSRVQHRINELFFDRDFKVATADTDRLIYNYDLMLNAARRAVITDMMFNLGYAGVGKFKRFIAAMIDSSWEVAAAEMLDSKWHTQVGKRAIRLANIMHTGIMHIKE